MAKGHHFDSHFEDILDNLDVELIAPLLITSGIISAYDQATLTIKLKASKKLAVKFILQKVRKKDNGDALFEECLVNSSNKSQNHLHLGLILYNSKGMGLRIYVCSSYSYVKCENLAIVKIS